MVTPHHHSEPNFDVCQYVAWPLCGIVGVILIICVIIKIISKLVSPPEKMLRIYCTPEKQWVTDAYNWRDFLVPKSASKIGDPLNVTISLRDVSLNPNGGKMLTMDFVVVSEWHDGRLVVNNFGLGDKPFRNVDSIFVKAHVGRPDTPLGCLMWKPNIETEPFSQVDCPDNVFIRHNGAVYSKQHRLVNLLPAPIHYAPADRLEFNLDILETKHFDKEVLLHWSQTPIHFKDHSQEGTLEFCGERNSVWKVGFSQVNCLRGETFGGHEVFEHSCLRFTVTLDLINGESGP